MTLRHMTIFCAVYENECNTTRAAAALNMTQPAVSLAIRELEQYYGVVLFDRLGKHLKISETGLQFYGYASHITALFNDMELAMKNSEKTGTVRIGVSISIGYHMLPAYIKSFKAKYPDAKVKAIIAPSEQLESKIISSDLDFAIIEGSVHHPDLITDAYMDDHLVIICSKDSRYSEGQTLTLEEFRSEAFLLREKKSATRELFAAVTKQAGIAIEPAWESASTSAIINGVKANIGVAVLPEMLVKPYIDNGSVKVINVEGLSFERSFKLIHHKDKLITPAIQEFINICKNHPVNG